MYGACRAWLKTGAIPVDPELKKQFSSIKYVINKRDEIQLISKEDMLKLDPDLDLDDIDALVTTFAHALSPNANAGGPHLQKPLGSIRLRPLLRRAPHWSSSSQRIQPLRERGCMTDERCGYCNQPIQGHSIVAVGPSKGQPKTEFFHVGCVRRNERRRIASSTLGRPTQEAGEGTMNSPPADLRGNVKGRKSIRVSCLCLDLMSGRQGLAQDLMSSISPSDAHWRA